LLSAKQYTVFNTPRLHQLNKLKKPNELKKR
jgi:hypothetical protein